MQPLDPANVYSAAVVKAALTGQLGSRFWDFRFDRLDSSNNFIEPMTNVLSATVSNDSLSTIKRTAKFSLLDSSGINYLSDRIRPWARLRMTDGGFVEWPLGVFLLSTPKRVLSPGQVVTREVDAYDQLLILNQDAVLNRYSIAAGTVVTTAIASLIAGYTFASSIVPSAATLAVATEWAPGTTVLSILNDLLSSINYFSATFDEQGKLVCRPYQLPSVRASEYTYADDSFSTLVGNTEQDLDLFDIPNVWQLIMSEADLATPLVGNYTNANPLSPTSTVSRGRTIPKIVTETTATDSATLNALAANMAFQDSQVFETVPFSTALMPIHSDSDVLTLSVSGLGISAKYAETAWSFDLKAGATMTHSVRRVVSV